MMNKAVADYINSQPKAQKTILKKIRDLIKSNVPKAEEAMGYGVASFKLNGKPFIYYAAFKSHIGIYTVPKTTGKLTGEIKKHQTGKGTMQFMLEQPIPYDLIDKIIKARLEEINVGAKKQA